MLLDETDTDYLELYRESLKYFLFTCLVLCYFSFFRFVVFYALWCGAHVVLENWEDADVANQEMYHMYSDLHMPYVTRINVFDDLGSIFVCLPFNKPDFSAILNHCKSFYKKNDKR